MTGSRVIRQGAAALALLALTGWGWSQSPEGDCIIHEKGRVGGRLSLDGSLGSRTASMRAPYLGNEPGRESWRGLLREGVDGGRLERRIAAASEAGLQPIAHAIGDEANHLLLDAYAEAAERNDARDARHRVEHAQHLLPSDIPRFVQLGTVASMQPFHKADDGRYAEKAIGTERLAGSYAFRQLLQSGALLCFGSDWPVCLLGATLRQWTDALGQIIAERPAEQQRKLWQTNAGQFYSLGR